jgi:hypothetical protein
MKIMHAILKTGNVYIASRCSPLLIASFISNDGKNVITVNSDRGIDHLLMLLVGKVDPNQSSLIQEANKKCTNSLSITNICEKVRVLESSYTKFSYSSEIGEFRVSIKQITAPSLTAVPGIYRKRAYGKTLEEALLSAMKTIPELQL